MKKILLISAERLGDTIFLTPALRFLHNQRPDLMVDMIAVTPLAGAVLSHNLHINHLYVSPTETVLKTIAHDYDAVFILHVSSEARAHAAHFNAKVIENHFQQEAMPAAEKSIQLFAEFFNLTWDGHPIAYELFPQFDDQQFVDELFQAKHVHVDQDIVIAMHVGCHGLAKKHTSWFKRSSHEKVWPLKNFVKLSRKLLKTFPQLKIVVTGSKAEEVLANKFLKKVPQAISVVNQTNVLQLAELLKRVRLFICSDTGTLHVACAMKTPLIGLYGPTDAAQTGPYPFSEYFSVLKNDNLAKLSVDEVFEVAREKIK